MRQQAEQSFLAWCFVVVILFSAREARSQTVKVDRFVEGLPGAYGVASTINNDSFLSTLSTGSPESRDCLFKLHKTTKPAHFGTQRDDFAPLATCTNLLPTFGALYTNSKGSRLFSAQCLVNGKLTRLCELDLQNGTVKHSIAHDCNLGAAIAFTFDTRPLQPDRAYLACGGAIYTLLFDSPNGLPSKSYLVKDASPDIHFLSVDSAGVVYAVDPSFVSAYTPHDYQKRKPSTFLWKTEVPNCNPVGVAVTTNSEAIFICRNGLFKQLDSAEDPAAPKDPFFVFNSFSKADLLSIGFDRFIYVADQKAGRIFQVSMLGGFGASK